MKMRILLLAFTFAILTTQSQEKNTVISETITGNIYKPKTVKATNSLISQLSLPDGFEIKKFADGLGKPRMMALGADGSIYVSRRKGDVLLLKDDDGDGIVNSKETILTKEGAHGVAVKDGYFYLITVNDVFKAKIKNDGTIHPLDKIVENLPDGGQHPNRTIKFGPDGMLYISVGSTCNACDETRDENATMVRVDENGGNRMIFAKGLRNTIGFDWNPLTRDMYGMDHGIDWLGDEEQKEEMNLIEKDKNYGWPYIYADGKFNKADEPKKMTWAAYAAKCKEPAMLFDAHSAPMDLIFYKGDMFPEEYKNSAIVSFHGSWNRKNPSGYNLKWISFDNNKPLKSNDFVTGFLTANNTAKFGRPVGLLELNDGSVLFSDDENGIIYRITYTN